MIAALERLKANTQISQDENPTAIASLKISGKSGGLLKLFSTHPDLDVRIAQLKKQSSLESLKHGGIHYD